MMQKSISGALERGKIGTKCCSNNKRNSCFLRFFALEIPPGMEMESCFTSSRLKESGAGAAPACASVCQNLGERVAATE